jgi:hypothetical protein
LHEAPDRARVRLGHFRDRQGEALFSVFRQRSSGITVAVGGGVLREADGVDVALSRIVVGRDFENWRLHGNVLFEKPLASNRDALDLITTVGWARRVAEAVSLGVEASARIWKDSGIPPKPKAVPGC